MLNEPTQVTSLRWKGHVLVLSLLLFGLRFETEAFLQGQWVSIEPPDTSTGVLFAGDMLERITNGKAWNPETSVWLEPSWLIQGPQW